MNKVAIFLFFDATSNFYRSQSDKNILKSPQRAYERTVKPAEYPGDPQKEDDQK